jgi:ABC-2 type transport system permease protein
MTKAEEKSGTSASLEGNVLPGSISQVGIVTKYEMINYFRSRRFYILLAIGLIITGLLTFLVAHFGVSKIGSTPLAFYSSWWGFSASFVVIFCAIFFGGDAISGEFQNKTGYFLVGNPIRRSSIYIGKWFAAVIASLMIIAVYSAITLANGFYYFGDHLPYQLGDAFIFTLVYLIATLGLTFFFSSLFKSSSFSILVSVILLLFGFTVIQELLGVFSSGTEPWFLLSYGSDIISNVLSTSYPAHKVTAPISPRGGPTVTTYTATIPEGLAIMFAYFAVTAVLGLVLFERKEFN